MNYKNVYIGLMIVCLVAIGGYFYPKSSTRVRAVSTSGSYFKDQNATSIVFAPATATSTSIINDGGSDRAITAVRAYCSSIGSSLTYLTGTGLINWSLLVATTSVANQGLQGNANYIGNVLISTSTGNGTFYVATTTEGVIAYTNRIWPVNAYLTFNTNATNTASCSYDADWISL